MYAIVPATLCAEDREGAEKFPQGDLPEPRKPSRQGSRSPLPQTCAHSPGSFVKRL